MNTRSTKEHGGKSRSVANRLAQVRSQSSAYWDGLEQNSQFVVQNKLQELAEESSLYDKTLQLQALADNITPASLISSYNKENKTGLPNSLKTGIESLSGYAMDDVKVHFNSDKPAQLNAYAFAQGTEIHIGSGKEKYLPHEAWHVVQQKQGRVQPTKQLKGKINVNDDANLEREADVMGDKAMRAANTNVGLENDSSDDTSALINGSPMSSTIQGYFDANHSMEIELVRRYVVQERPDMLEEFDRIADDDRSEIGLIDWISQNFGFEHINEVFDWENGAQGGIGEIDYGLEDGGIEESVEASDENVWAKFLQDTSSDEIRTYVGVLPDLDVDISGLMAGVVAAINGGQVPMELLEAQVLGALQGLMPTEGDDSDAMQGDGHDDEPAGVGATELIETEYLQMDYWKATDPGWLESLFMDLGVVQEFGEQVGRATFENWLSAGVMTRAQIREKAAEIAAQSGSDDTAQPMQFARGAGPSGPKSYPTSARGPYVGVQYTKDDDGYFKFTAPTQQTVWKDPTEGAIVDMESGYTKTGYGLLKDQKTVVELKTATRSQHFSIANRITGQAGSGSPANFTWHHLKEKYKMILVDREVHRKHGHNGGVYLWDL
ncbi:MAG: HNH endonuclease [Reichenbachiella sp.]|uniref:HNH endonuclease n=1 Tax=Reichenbachiella sp. TaxID=2184521 RepID=UPI0032677761